MQTKYWEVERINNDVNGNPRYVIHFTSLNIPMSEYGISTKKTRKAGIRKYHNKQYGGGYVFTSYNVEATLDYIYKTIHE